GACSFYPAGGPEIGVFQASVANTWRNEGPQAPGIQRITALTREYTQSAATDGASDAALDTTVSEPGSEVGETRRHPALVTLLTTADALGVNTKQHLLTVPSPLRSLSRSDAPVQPRGHTSPPQVTGSAGERASLLLLTEDLAPRPLPRPRVDTNVQLLSLNTEPKQHQSGRRYQGVFSRWRGRSGSAQCAPTPRPRPSTVSACSRPWSGWPRAIAGCPKPRDQHSPHLNSYSRSWLVLSRWRSWTRGLCALRGLERRPNSAGCHRRTHRWPDRPSRRVFPNGCVHAERVSMIWCETRHRHPRDRTLRENRRRAHRPAPNLRTPTRVQSLRAAVYGSHASPAGLPIRGPLATLRPQTPPRRLPLHPQGPRIQQATASSTTPDQSVDPHPGPRHRLLERHRVDRRLHAGALRHLPLHPATFPAGRLGQLRLLRVALAAVLGAAALPGLRPLGHADPVGAGRSQDRRARGVVLDVGGRRRSGGRS